MTHGADESVRYAEDRVGLSLQVWACLSLPIVVQVVTTALAPIAVWSSVLGAMLTLEICGAAFVSGCYARGIRITTEGIRIGGCRRAERRRRRGRSATGRVAPASKFRREFVVPWGALREAVVVDRRGFPSLSGDVVVQGARGRSRSRRTIGDLSTPWATSMLVLSVDLSKVEVPELSPYVVDQLTPRTTSSRYALTDTWLIATRHPDLLRESLSYAGSSAQPCRAGMTVAK